MDPVGYIVCPFKEKDWNNLTPIAHKGRIFFSCESWTGNNGYYGYYIGQEDDTRLRIVVQEASNMDGCVRNPARDA